MTDPDNPYDRQMCDYVAEAVDEVCEELIQRRAAKNPPYDDECIYDPRVRCSDFTCDGC
jgi:hypothetical protein